MLQLGRRHAPAALHKQLRHRTRRSPRQHFRSTRERSDRMTPIRAGACKRSRVRGLQVLWLQNLRSEACCLHFARPRRAFPDWSLEQRRLTSVEPHQ
eukprot:1977097-Rhodomonas_salina.1